MPQLKCLGGWGRGLKNATATLSHRYVDWAADVVRGGAVDVVGGGQLRFLLARPKYREKGFLGKTPPAV